MDKFLAKSGSQADVRQWTSRLSQVQLTTQQISLLGSFRRDMKILCMAAAWCSDCAQQCPILGAIAQVCPRIDLRFVDRDDDSRLADELVLCASPRIPQVVFLDEDGNHVGRYGDRTLATYRMLNDELSGRSKSNFDVAAATQDWLNEIERVQWLLRTSPRLRQRHGD